MRFCLLTVFAKASFVSVFCLTLTFATFAQKANVPTAVLVRIVKAEDELRFDRDLQELLKSPNANVRQRAALASGRIGDETAIGYLLQLLEKDSSADVRLTTAFALGEIESVKAVDQILRMLAQPDETDAVRARLLEAAGKIAAANAKDEKSVELGEVILDALEAEYLKQTRDRWVVLLGLTAAMRAKAKEAEFVIGKFLSDKDARIRADALNALVRLRVKNDDLKGQYRALLLSDDDSVVRANAARAAGAAEDQEALELLIEAATNDDDQRVRVSAIRALASLNDKKAAAPLLDHGAKTLALYKKAFSLKNQFPSEKNELLEILTTLGKLLANTNDEKFYQLSVGFQQADFAAENYVAMARVLPAEYFSTVIKVSEAAATKLADKAAGFRNWQYVSSIAQGAGELATLPSNEENDRLRADTTEFLGRFVRKDGDFRKLYAASIPLAMPDVLRAFAAFKPADLSQVLREHLNEKDVIIRATAAELLSEQPFDEAAFENLKTACSQALLSDKEINDAQLASLTALVKLDKNKAVGALKLALTTPDLIVRRHAATLVEQNGLALFPDLQNADKKIRMFKPENKSASRLGVITNSQLDYARAVSRRNGQTKAILTTEKGVFTIELLPEDAPLTVDNFVKLARSNYFNGVAFHRVVPNFVVQGGDPRGDGNGGPGWHIRDEINFVSYERGTIGMALSGKDTGGSQWFVTHSPQPHLDGGYTVFGRVNDQDMKIADKIARGDKILSVKVIEGNAPLTKTTKRRGRK